MPDNWVARTRYYAGNGVRLVSSTWLQRTINPDIATTIFGCSFGDGGWHHLRQTLDEYDTNPVISPKVTTLWRFLRQFCPTSISGLAGVTNEEPLPLFIYPWGPFNPEGAVRKESWRSRFCGPSTDSFIEEEFARTVRLYQAVRAEGYRPYRYPNSFIGGTWLVANNGDKRFVVMQGNHRMAALAHLGYSAIRVRRIRQALSFVFERDLPKWPLVLKGRCSEDHARRVFRFFFEQTGLHVASQVAPGKGQSQEFLLHP